MRLLATSLVTAVGVTFTATAARAQGPPPPPPPPPMMAAAPTTPLAGTSAISGTVVDAVTGKPVPGAIVSLFAFGSASIRPPRQMTDESGRFLFAGLPASQNYQLTAVKLGYFDGAFGRTTPRGSLRPIVVNDGQHVADATVMLFRASAISGTVLDEFGEGVVGVVVALQSRIPIGGESRWVSGPVTTTDDRGVYRIPSLPPGTYALMVPSVQHAVPAGLSLEELTGWTRENLAAAQAAGRDIPLQHTAQVTSGTERVFADIGFVGPLPPRGDGRPQVYPSTFHPAARSLGSAAAIELGVGEERIGVDVQLRPVLAANVSGRVVGPPDAIAGLTLRLLPAGSEDGWIGLEAATARVRDDGTFTFVGVPDGHYTILANKFVAGYVFNPTGTLLTTADRLFRPPSVLGSESGSSVSSAPSGTMFWMLTPREPSRHSGRASVEIAGRSIENVVVTLQGGVTISGRLVVETSAEGTTPTLPSILQVRAEPADGDPSLGQPLGRVDINDPGSVFQIDGVLPGEYLLRLFPGVGVIKSVTWNQRDLTDTPVAVGDQPMSGVVITVTTDSARVQGAVRDGQGRPAVNASVICFPVDPARRRRYGAQPARIRSVSVSTDGVYRLAALPAGDYLIVAVDDALADAWKNPEFLQRASAAATRISVGWNETKMQDLGLAVVK